MFGNVDGPKKRKACHLINPFSNSKLLMGVIRFFVCSIL